ncbi:uncharacterized protein [Pyrus communis]|uniref:uncharacterized protein n=1 Tax=Pyrus communis TaxID=23211 RepID=UPI0035C0792C
MSKRLANALTINDTEHEKEFVNNQSYVVSDYDRQFKRVCRISCIQNYVDVFLSKSSPIIQENSAIDYQDGTSTSSVQQDVENISSSNINESHCMTVVEKNVLLRDKKGKKVVNVLDQSTKNTQQTLDDQNNNLMNKGQAFFQKNRKEITREFENKPGFKPEDRPDIISRIFKMKLDHMIDFIKSGKPFGEIQANVCTVEFQKRGFASLEHQAYVIALPKKGKKNC